MLRGLTESLIVPLQPSPGGQQVSLDLRISRIVQFTCEHFLFFTAEHAPSPSSKTTLDLVSEETAKPAGRHNKLLIEVIRRAVPLLTVRDFLAHGPGR
jgi:hypothetical protein